ncbi:hypothetical protein [Paenibacillus terreus]|uniref:hypothetical protein n=1 Tax=Paenibacillus terreus TaxID=1387834 RepID=UPI0035CD0F4B
MTKNEAIAYAAPAMERCNNISSLTAVEILDEMWNLIDRLTEHDVKRPSPSWFNLNSMQKCWSATDFTDGYPAEHGRQSADDRCKAATRISATPDLAAAGATNILP